MNEFEGRSLLDVVLAYGVDDWVYAAWVHEIAKRSGLRDENDLRALAIGLIAEVLVRGLMVAGEVYDGRHVPWECSAASAIERIAEEWVAWGERPLTPGAIVWLEVTAEGRSYLERAGGAA